MIEPFPFTFYNLFIRYNFRVAVACLSRWLLP